MLDAQQHRNLCGERRPLQRDNSVDPSARRYEGTNDSVDFIVMKAPAFIGHETETRRKPAEHSRLFGIDLWIVRWQIGRASCWERCYSTVRSRLSPYH